MVQKLIPMVLVTMGIPQLQVDVPVGRLCRFFVAVCVKTVEIPQLRLVVFF